MFYYQQFDENDSYIYNILLLLQKYFVNETNVCK
jgi:hypothetical protein